MQSLIWLAILTALEVHARPYSEPSALKRRDIFVAVTSSVMPNVPVSTTVKDGATAQILPTPSTVKPDTTGTVVTSLERNGRPTAQPLISTSIATPATRLSVPGPAAPVISNLLQANAVSDNIFQPIATDSPPSQIGSRPDHPAPRLGIKNQTSPIGTNKFYANFFLGSQGSSSWTHPYSLMWSKGGGATKSWGLSVAHIEDNQKVFGPDASSKLPQYFINPIGIQSVVISALELGNSTQLTTDSLTAFSANVNLLPKSDAPPAITFPLVQGMGFVTAIYSGGTPLLQSGVLFRSVTKSTTAVKPDITKFTIVLEDGKKWLLYAQGSGLDLKVVNNGLVQATSTFKGTIQIAKDPGEAEALYDAASGAYPTTVELSGSVNGEVGSYKFSFTKAGLQNTTLLMFALPHHVASFSKDTQSSVTKVQLTTTTKGKSTAVVADSWVLDEKLPTGMGFAPSNSATGKGTAFSGATAGAIREVAAAEVAQNMSEQSNLNSMYYSGKALAKFAGIIYTLNDLTGDTGQAQAGLKNLKAAFDVFTSNKQQHPLVHETAWGGVVSTASYDTGDPGVDFGNTYYNDHHFHYGYFVYAAAIIGHLDQAWLDANKAWVNTLVRDFANPTTQDTYFPVYRNFDWYHGHSFAHGLYEIADGRDEESSSEDTMSAYALKMWGNVIGDANMEARGNLQLAITARSLQSYFLYESTNTIQPANFIGNKVSGILFENKIDHTTYFGANPEYIQGIHMLPLLPASTLTRKPNFVKEEWDTYFSNGRAEGVVGGWKGVLFANLALMDPKGSWDFFSQNNFDGSWLDGGASRTWYMAMAAGLGGL